MEREKRNKKQVIIGISVLLLVTLLLLGLTYAYYRTRIIGNSNSESINVTSKVLEVEYGENSNQVIDNDGKPIDLGYQAVKDFEVKNNSDEKVSYNIVLDKISTTFTRNDWTYELYKLSETEATTTTVGGKEIKGTLVTSGVITNKLKRQIIAQVDIEGSATDKYSLVVTYESLSNVDQSDDISKTLSLRVNIAAIEDNIFNDQETGTLLYAIGRDNTITNPKTTPGEESTKGDEMELAFTTDDYGTSYYYRGDVDNNYVSFADMCWRIVRVQGDGSIKITLYDEQHPCDSSVDHQTGAFITDGGIGSDVLRIPYSSGTLDFGSSIVESTLRDWYGFETINLSTYEKDIETEAEWCNGIRESDRGASLLCKSVNGESDEIYIGKIGLLSLDEIVFAGAPRSADGPIRHGYLLDATYGSFWTISCSSWGEGGVYYYQDGPGFVHSTVANDGVATRPALVLKSTTKVTGDGDGKKTTPYIVS